MQFSHLGTIARPSSIAQLMSMALENPKILSLAAGFTDTLTLPEKTVSQIVRQLSRQRPPEHLQYGTNQGRPKLRQLIAARLGKPILSRSILAAQTIVTNGSQQSLYLAIQALCNPGDTILVDNPTYFVFLEMLAGLDVTPIPFPTTPSNLLDPAALDKLLSKLRRNGTTPRALYLCSYHSNPSGRTLTLDEKLLLARTLKKHRLQQLPILEDAAYRDLHFSQKRNMSPSLLELPQFAQTPVLYLGTFTKPFATGLKIGYAISNNKPWLDRLLHIKAHHDFGSSNFNQSIIETALQNGHLDTHLRRTLRPAYKQKMQTLHRALRTAGLHKLGWQWTPPAGGLYLWLQAPQHLDTSLTSPFFRACLNNGVSYVPGDLCRAETTPPKNYIRASFGVLSTTDLKHAATRLTQTAAQFPK